MATFELPADRTAARFPTKDPSPGAPMGALQRLQAFWVKSDSLAPVLGMFAYFLLLGSIAVVTMTGQVPWFTLAPATVLAVVVHCRRLEAKWARESSSERIRSE